MGVAFRLGRTGKTRPFWYGEYKTKDGQRVSVNLGVKIAGDPPKSLKVSDGGNHAFERSRAEAAAKLKALQEEAVKGRITKTDALRNYRERTGATLKETPIAALPDIWKDGTGEGRRKRRAVASFAAWACGKGVKTVLEVSTDIAKEYLECLYTRDGAGAVLAATTVRRSKIFLGMTFDRALPEGAPNPFRAKHVTITRHKDDKEYHREPLTEDEVGRLVGAAQSDELAHDLIVCALSTGLRKGDVCRLRWDGVNLRANALRLTASKTKTDLYLPILPAFKAVLERRMAERQSKAAYVFPEAERMLRDNPDGITYRVKKIFAVAFAQPEEALAAVEATPPREDLADALEAVLGAVNAATMQEGKRDTMVDFVRRYAAGQSVRDIEKETGKPRSTVSNLLNEAQRLSGTRFLNGNPSKGGGIKTAIEEITRVKRKHGMKAASKYDFHALRTTFVTIAIKNGISIDKLRALTGHATVEIVMRHYFKPKGTDFSNELAQAMPEALTGTREVKQLPPPTSQQGQLDEIVTKLSTLSPKELKKIAKILNKGA